MSSILAVALAAPDLVTEATNTVKFWVLGLITVVVLWGLAVAYVKKDRTLFFISIGLMVLMVSIGVAWDTWVAFIKNVTENVLT